MLPTLRYIIMLIILKKVIGSDVWSVPNLFTEVCSYVTMDIHYRDLVILTSSTDNQFPIEIISCPYYTVSVENLSSDYFKLNSHFLISLETKQMQVLLDNFANDLVTFASAWIIAKNNNSSAYVTNYLMDIAESRLFTNIRIINANLKNASVTYQISSLPTSPEPKMILRVSHFHYPPFTILQGRFKCYTIKDCIANSGITIP